MLKVLTLMFILPSDSLFFVSLLTFVFFSLKHEMPRESIALDCATSRMYLYRSSINLRDRLSIKTLFITFSGCHECVMNVYVV